MKKIILFLSIICLTLVSAAQESNDFGLFLGTSYIHQSTILPVPGNLPNSQPDLGIGGFYRKNLNPRYALRFGGYAGFNSADIHALFEFNFLPLNPRHDTPKVSTFVASGLAATYDVTNLFRPAIPFNVGVKYRVTERFGLSVEWNIRRLLTVGVNSPDSDDRWRSLIGITANYNVIKTCKTCPYYESNRKRKR